jgi:hypothetical protein
MDEEEERGAEKIPRSWHLPLKADPTGVNLDLADLDNDE